MPYEKFYPEERIDLGTLAAEPKIKDWSSSWTISKRGLVYPICFALYIFLLSYLILPFHTGSDQIAYRKVYEALPGMHFIEGFLFFHSYTSSREPGYYILVYVFSRLISKDLLMSVLNAAMGFYLSRYMLRNRIAWHIILLLSLNYYLVILLFTVERLKLGLLLAMMATVSSMGIFRYSLWGCAVLTQVQTALLIISKVSANIFASLLPLFRGRLRLRMVFSFIGLLFLGGLLFFLREHILAKFESFIRLGGLTDLAKPLLFAALTLYYARNKRVEALAMQAPLLLASFILGGERIVIFSYFVFMYYALQYRYGSNLGVYVTSFYFLVKGLLYIKNILIYGKGLIIDAG